jgi:hypothetical protein
MKRRLFQRWTIWLLPLLLARAFVPTGFMLSAHAGELSLVFCSSVANDAEQFSEHAEHHHRSSQAVEDEEANSVSSEGGVIACPFALAGGAPSAEIASFVEHPEPIRYLSSFAPLSFASIGPQRADRIRGPPHLS